MVQQKIEDVILFQIDLTSKVTKQYSQRAFDELKLGITVEQWVILKIVSERPALSQKELAVQSYRDPASITRTLDLLEKKGLLMRTSMPDNRRTYQIDLTQTGKTFITQHLPLVEAQRAKSIEGLSSEELHQLSSILKKIRNNMS